MTLRPATKGDLDGIVGTFLGCWRESYARVLPPHLVDLMTDDRASTLWARALREAAPGEIIVAESDETPVAAILGVTRYAVGDSGEGMVHSLYVSPHAQGGGVGSRLLDAACSALAAAGVTTTRLWVFSENTPSLDFYRRSGWVPDGATRTEDEFGEPELRLSKACQPEHAR